MKRRNLMLRVTMLSVLSLIMLTWFFTRNSSPQNLIANPGFEAGSNGRAAEWFAAGDVAWVTDEVVSGERAMRLRSTGRSARIISNAFQAPAHSRVEVSAWMKAENVAAMGPYQKLRVTVQMYAADRETRVRHFDVVSTSGSFPWKQFRSSILVPEDAVYLELEFQLTETTGTIWVDDVEAVLVQTVPEVRPGKVKPPVLLPEPWQIITYRDTALFERVVVMSCQMGPRLEAALDNYLAGAGIPQCSDGRCAGEGPVTYIVTGDGECNQYYAQMLADRFPGVSWEDLGEQGYFLSVGSHTGYSLIFLGANSEQGRYYGLQTMKQLVDLNNKTVLQTDIVDRPSLDRRGIIMGVQWFYEQEEAFRRISELKLNMVWNQGSFVNEKFWFRWREPLSASEEAEMRAYLERAHNHFVEPFVAIAPRGKDASNPTIYSSDEEINLVVAKMRVLYNLGLRNFGLSFDDLANFGQDRLSGPDVDIFNNLAEAHLHFIEQVYWRFRADHSDITFAVVPMIYSGLSGAGDDDLVYLETLGQLPPEIMLYTSPEYTVEADLVRDVTGRPHLVWDNFYAHFYYAPAPQYVVPLDRPGNFDQTRIAGYTFLPLIPVLEDEALITWQTAANYAWAPERHDAERSFQKAAARQAK
jgi:hypothetical protein